MKKNPKKSKETWEVTEVQGVEVKYNRFSLYLPNFFGGKSVSKIKKDIRQAKCKGTRNENRED